MTISPSSSSSELHDYSIRRDLPPEESSNFLLEEILEEILLKVTNEILHKDLVPIRDTEKWKQAATYIENQDYENAQSAFETAWFDPESHGTKRSYDLWILIEKVLIHPFSEDGLKLLVNLLYRIFENTSNWEKIGKAAYPTVRVHLILNICQFWSQERAEDGTYFERMRMSCMESFSYGIFHSETKLHDDSIRRDLPPEESSNFSLEEILLKVTNEILHKDLVPIRDTEKWKQAATYIENQDYENAQSAFETAWFDPESHGTKGSYDLWILIEKVLIHPFSEDGLKLLVNLLYRIFEDTSNWEKVGKAACPTVRAHLILNICKFWSQERAEDGAYSERMRMSRMESLFYGIFHSETNNQIELSVIQNAPEETKNNYILMTDGFFTYTINGLKETNATNLEEKLQIINSWRIT